MSDDSEITAGNTAAPEPGSGKFHPTHCFYINLAHRDDRRAFMEAGLASLGLPYSRWPACWIPDLNKIPDPPRSAFETQGVEPYLYENGALRGTLGCYQSHVSVLREIARTGQRQYLVLEDDVKLGDVFLERARTLVNRLPAFDIVMFDCLGPRRSEDRYLDAIYRPSTTYPCYHGAHTLLVSGPGARRILDAISRLPIKDIDGLYLGAAGIDCFVVYTGALEVGGFRSDRYPGHDVSKTS